MTKDHAAHFRRFGRVEAAERCPLAARSGLARKSAARAANRAVLSGAAAGPPDVRTGDALAVLPDIAGHIDPNIAVVVLHSFVLYQFTPGQRARLDAILRDLAKRRPVTRIALESNVTSNADLELHTYTFDSRRSRALATADPHGRWLRWTG